MRIGTDVDDVLRPHTEQLIVFHNLVRKGDLQFEDIVHFEFTDHFQLSQPEAEQIFLDFFESKDFHLLQPSDDAVIELTVLKNLGHEIFGITSQPDQVRPKTQLWIPKSFPGIFSALYFSQNVYTHLASGKTKAEIADDLQLDVYVDDSIPYCLAVAKVVKIVFLYTQPWNENITDLPTNIIRVDNWHQISAMIQNM